MTIARFHQAVFGSNISSPALTYRRLERIGVNLAKDSALTAALVKRARAAFERYKQSNPQYVQRLQSAAKARAVRRDRVKGRTKPEGLAVPIPEGARELAMPLHVIPERKRVETLRPRKLDAEVQDREIAVMLLRAAVALLNR